MSSRALSLLFLAGLNLSTAYAEEAVFAIRGYQLTGNTLLNPARIEQTLESFTGPQQTFDNVQAAVKSVEKLYADAGYGAVRVLIPEQEVDNGTIRLQVVEAKLGKIEVEGNQFFTSDNIRAAVPSLESGQMPNMDAISRSLRIANENPAKRTNLVFRPSKNENEVDALLRVEDEAPLKFALSLDNTGTQATGNFRVGLLAQHANLLGKDHTASMQILTSPGHENDVSIVGLGYRIPLYRQGDSIEASYGYSNVNSGTVQIAGGSLGISGKGQVAGLRYNHQLDDLNQWEQKLSFGLDYRAYTNAVIPSTGGTSLIPDITVHPISVTYNASHRDQEYELSAYLTWMHNLPGGAEGKQQDFTASRAGATSNYQIWRYGLNFSYLLPANWLARASFAGQYSEDMLVSGEQYGVAGQDSVRGFLERELASDKGQRLNLELYSPDFAGFFSLADWRLQALAFHDIGRIQRNRPAASEIASDTIASAGLGLRLGHGKNFSMKLDYAVVTQAGGAQHKGDARLHGSLIWFF